jgi:preprotein translocase subunit SecY
MKRSAWRYLWMAPDLRRKLLITLGILVLYRLAAHVPVPGVNHAVLKSILNAGGSQGAFVGLLDLLSGGTVSQFSVLAMGVYPYITAQIILQILVPIVPSWKARMDEDPREGQKWMERWTYILSIPMAALQAIGQISLFSAFAGGRSVLKHFGWSGANLLPTLTVIIAMTAGTMFAIWLGELISEYGLRNQGLSLIIFAGIVARMPSNFARLMSDQQHRWAYLGISLVVTVATIFLIVYVQQGRRNVPVMYPGRRIGTRMSMPVKGTFPLMVNLAGMIPLIFAQSLLALPGILAGFFLKSGTAWVANLAVTMQRVFAPTSPWYWLTYFLMVVLFTFFYTDVLFMQQNYGEQLKRSGAKIPGVPPGERTQQYLMSVLRRITLPGALFLGFVAVLPYLLTLMVPGLAAAGRSGLLLISSAGLLIVVGVVRDIFFFIDAELRLHGYTDTLLVR